MKPIDPANYTLESIVGASGFTLGQMLAMYRDAPNKGEQLRALADLSGLSQDDIKALLLANGFSPKEMPRVKKKDGPKPGVDADEAHTLLAQLQEALRTASTAAAAIVGLLEGYERTAKEANAKLDRLREFLKKEGGE